jgi:DNA-binding LacI/PurR family transcriptional regulator
MPTPPTMRELAVLAGCSQTTVSLALRNHPRITRATRERILAIAHKAGYTKDPLISTLMTQLRSSRKARSVEKLAMLTWWDTPGARHNPRGIALHDGIYSRAHELGYEIEEFWAREPGMSLTRLDRILHARSIRGIIFMSMLHARGRVSLDWSHFAPAAAGPTILRPGMHHAAHSFMQGMVLALRNLKRLGYSRIGYVNIFEQDDMSNNGWLSAFMGYQHRLLARTIIPPLLTKSWDKAKLSTWIEQHKIQAVVSNMHIVLEMMRELGLRVPEEIGFASLDCFKITDACAGVDILRAEIGAKTVDLVVEQLQNNEFGLPAIPKTVSLEGSWCDGPTLKKN